MPRFVEHLGFDSNLFNLTVGRLDLSENDVELLSRYPSINDILLQAHSSGFELIYVFAPPQNYSQNEISKYSFPGTIYDTKMFYTMNISSLDRNFLFTRAFVLPPNISIVKYSSLNPKVVSEELINLAIASGIESRFFKDTSIGVDNGKKLFQTWIINSCNKTAADEVIIARDSTTGKDIGMVTVQKKGSNKVNIGLLAVNSDYRQMGIATILMSRATLWTLEELGFNNDIKLTVITQKQNVNACRFYEKFGYSASSTQDVYHVWLPKDLIKNTGMVSRHDVHSHVIPFCKQHITGTEIDNINQVLINGLDSAAHFTSTCSTRIQDILGPSSDRVIMVPSGTAALEMAALLCGLEAGDEVIMPSYTFSSTANAFVLRGAVPVFVDIRRDTLNIDEKLIEAAITAKTKVICVVHYAGIPCEMDTICEIAKKHKLLVVEDAAQAFLSTYKGKQCGSIGDFGCFSFHYTKNIICGEGGAISVNKSTEYVRKALIYWEKGTNRYDFMMGKIDKYYWIDVGSSYVPNELSCAVLSAQLDKCHSIIEKRINYFTIYYNKLLPLHNSGLLQLVTLFDGCETNAHIFPIILPNKETKIKVEKYLQGKGVSAFSHYVPLHSAPAGIKFGKTHGDMTVTDFIFTCLLRLPIWIDMTSDNINSVANYVIECLEN